MIRIVGVQRGENPSREFVLLQNQGGLRVNLRGHVLISDNTLNSRDLSKASHIFADDILIPAGMYVLLGTGSGEPRWVKSRDGSLVFHTYMNRTDSVWETAQFPIHLLTTQHSHFDRKEPLLAMR